MNDICLAINAIKESDIVSLFEMLEVVKEEYKLCINKNTLQVYFCEKDNIEKLCSDEKEYNIKVYESEIREKNKFSIIDKLENKYGKCIP
ncbi:hypothetical protein [Tenacibaculum geojense]|uniref:Uncharacterized protein n=1 Tax=Tenacibaculum geojense TaxID=915352 RepID=A0ABW3JQX7_9FLAO